MLKELNEQEFRNLISYIKENIGIKLNFKLDPNCEHVNILEMRSEDGLNELQGVVYSEVIKKQDFSQGNIFSCLCSRKI